MVNRKVTASNEQVVKEVCYNIVSRPQRANHVTLNELAEIDRIEEELGEVDSHRPRYIGKILTEAEWAQKWSRGTYTIDTDWEG